MKKLVLLAAVAAALPNTLLASSSYVKVQNVTVAGDCYDNNITKVTGLFSVDFMGFSAEADEGGRWWPSCALRRGSTGHGPA